MFPRLLLKKQNTHSVVGMFTGSDTDIEGLEGLSNGRVSNGIIGSGRLFNEPRLQGLKLLHVLNSLRDIPDLFDKGVRTYVGLDVIVLGKTHGWRPPSIHSL